MATATQPLTKRLSFAKQRTALFRTTSVIGEDWIVERTVNFLGLLGLNCVLASTGIGNFSTPVLNPDFSAIGQVEGPRTTRAPN